MPTTHSGQPDPGPATPAGTEAGPAEARSESLLPAGDEQDDGRFAVAEEVSLDQQSDAARRVGALPPDPAPGVDLNAAVAGTVTKDDAAQAPDAGSSPP
jgi:hypothetical protein